MNLKLTLSTATALGLLMGVAWAGGNKAILNQTGDAGDVTIQQTGSNGEVGLDQVSGFGNKATISQGGNNNWTGDVTGSPLKQDGDRNSLTITQSGSYNDINKGDQSGDNNALTINQDGSGSNSVNNVIEFSQTSDPTGQGTGNGTRGAGSSAGRTKAISPFGNYNYAATSPVDGKWGYVRQGGSNNKLYSTEDSSGQTAYGNGVIAYQLGANATATLKQTGGNNFSMIDQFGSGPNKINIGQDNDQANNADSYNLAHVRQGNYGNTANITQGVQGAGVHKNDAFVNQTDAYNSLATISQTGSFNVAGIQQAGLTLTATVNQTGSLNDAGIQQTGSTLTATANQGGSSNSVTIVQSGSENTTTSSQSGTGNIASITQN